MVSTIFLSFMCVNLFTPTMFPCQLQVYRSFSSENLPIPLPWNFHIPWHGSHPSDSSFTAEHCKRAKSRSSFEAAMSARVKQTSVAQQEPSNMGVMQFSMCTSEVSFSYVSTRLLRKRCQLCVSSRHFHQIWCSCGLHLIFSVIVLVLKPMYLHPISSFGHKLWEKSYLSYASWIHWFEGAEQIEVCLRILVNS